MSYILIANFYRYLAFIGISKESKFEQEKALVDYDIQVFQDTLTKVFSRH